MTCLSAQLQEFNKDVTSKQESLRKAVQMISNRSTRVEEYTVQILDVLENVPHMDAAACPDQVDEEEAEACPSARVPAVDSDESQCNPWVFPAARSVIAKPFRMMSVPAHVHRKQMSRQLSRDSSEDPPDAPLYPMYFRRKFPQVRTPRYV